MAVKIRLARRGRKNKVTFDVVVASARSPRDGRFIEKLGTYNPLTNPATIELKDDRAFTWLMTGTEPSDTVRAILSYRGIMLKKHLQIGVSKGAITQEEADTKLTAWLQAKDQKIQQKRDKLAGAKQADAKARKELESKVKEARAEAARQREMEANKPPEPQSEPAVEQAGNQEAKES